MDDVVLFRPRATLDAEANLRDFVRFSRDDLTAFGDDLPFDEDVWDITGHVVKPGHTNQRIRIVFSRLGEPFKGNPVALREPLLSFAKAYLRYQHALRPVRIIGARLNALRVLEAILADFGDAPNPVDATPDVFNRAAMLLQERNSPTFAFQSACELERISTFLVEHRISKVAIRWTSFVPKPKPDATRVGPEFDRLRAERLPSRAALEALAEIYQRATRPEEILVTSLVVLLLCAPSRIGEALSLPLRCEHRDRDEDSGEERYGFRWWPAKGADPLVKPVVTSMGPLAQEALKKIRKVTKPARAVASWYDKHPTELYLPPELEHLRKREHLSMRDLAAIFGTPLVRTPLFWCRRHGMQMEKQEERWLVRFADVERQLINDLPKGFPFLPDTDLRFKDLLFIARKHELNPKYYTSPCCFAPVGYSQITELLGAHAERGNTSIFSKHGFTEPDGTPIRLRTHQLRHYLNDLGQKGGLSQSDIALWSGRKSIQQNEVYDHESATELLARLQSAIGDDEKIVGPLAELPERLPMDKEDYAKLRVSTALLTDAGVCTHDYAISPCVLHNHCIDCEEHVYVKNAETRSRIAAMHEDGKALLQQAQEAKAKGYAGANRWVKKHRSTVTRLGKIRSVLEDPEISYGTFLHLPAALGSEG